MQLTLFTPYEEDPDQSRMFAIEQRLSEMEESLGKVRRALFARHGELAKMYCDLLHEYDILIRTLCAVETVSEKGK